MKLPRFVSKLFSLVSPSSKPASVDAPLFSHDGLFRPHPTVGPNDVAPQVEVASIPQDQVLAVHPTQLYETVASLIMFGASADASPVLAYVMLEQDIREHHAPTDPWIDALQSLRLQRRRSEEMHSFLRDANESLGQQVDELTARCTHLAGILEGEAELNGRIEELLARGAVLEQRLRQTGAPVDVADRELAEQLVLVRAGEREEDSDGVADNPVESQDQLISDSESEAGYRVAVAPLESKAFWTLSQQDSRISVPILDAAWIEDVHNGRVSFCAGTSLRVLMRTQTYQPADGSEPYVRQSVTRVLQVMPPAKQKRLASVPPAAAAAARAGKDRDDRHAIKHTSRA